MLANCFVGCLGWCVYVVCFVTFVVWFVLVGVCGVLFGCVRCVCYVYVVYVDWLVLLVVFLVLLVLFVFVCVVCFALCVFVWFACLVCLFDSVIVGLLGFVIRVVCEVFYPCCMFRTVCLVLRRSFSCCFAFCFECFVLIRLVCFGWLVSLCLV